MRIFDPNVKKHITKYIGQSVIAMIMIFIVLLITEHITNDVMVASLGASTFIAFTMPCSRSSDPRYLIGGYAVGILSGILMNTLTGLMRSADLTVLSHPPHVFTCALAVGIAMFVMTATNLEHPPAAALAMGLTLDSHIWISACIAMSSIIIISVTKTLLKKHLRDLL